MKELLQYKCATQPKLNSRNAAKYINQPTTKLQQIPPDVGMTNTVELRCTRKLFQKSYIILTEQTNVVDAVL